MITGFRLGFTGAQGYYGVDADLVTYGKIIGAGMPVGAYGGKKEILSMVAPAGPVYQAGTLSGNPVAMQAGLAQLSLLREHPEIYTELNEKGDWFFGELKKLAEGSGLGCRVNHTGSLEVFSLQKNRWWIMHQPRLRTQSFLLPGSVSC